MRLDGLIDALRSRPGSAPGVQAWSLFASEGRRFGLGVKDGQVGNPHAPPGLAESGGARYHLIWDDGLVSRGYLEPRQVEGEPRQALAQARAAAYADPDAAWILGASGFPEVEIHDAAAAAVAGGDTGLFARRLDEVRQRVAGCKTWSASFSASEGSSRVVSSAGLEATSRGTSIGWHVSVNGEVGDGFSGRRAETDAEFATRLERVLELARHLAGPAPALDGRVRPVLLDPGVVEEYVLGTLLDNLAGARVAHGEGAFRREQFGSGEVVVREDMSLHLDPLQPMKSGSYRFTTEGVPAGRCTFIEHGRLVRPLLDLKYARRLGLDPTPLPLALDTLAFGGSGALEQAEALAEAGDDGVYVLSVLGVHTQDGASGDFSLSAPQALALRDGSLGGRVRGTLSGNLFAALKREELRFVRFAGEHTPGLLLPCRFDPA